jgi:hypothetical protein
MFAHYYAYAPTGSHQQGHGDVATRHNAVIPTTSRLSRCEDEKSRPPGMKTSPADQSYLHLGINSNKQKG